MNYYNEFDPKAAAWLRQLIYIGEIPSGVVDERSVLDVCPDDLAGFTQHHFFAGIGGWSLALEMAGWPEDRPVWTASLPCQPFSAAGKQKGKDDERHLWPHFYDLIKECRPNTIFGEQVESAIRHGWLDDLQTDLEAEDYAVGHCVLGAHSVGAAHIRQRLYWVANAFCDNDRGEVGRVHGEKNSATTGDWPDLAESRKLSGTGEYVCSGIGNTEGTGARKNLAGVWTIQLEPGEVDWLYCRDGKYRPIEPGIKPLVDWIPKGMVYSSDSSITPNETQEARLVRLKGYGNAIVPQVAAEFIRAFRGC